VGRNLNSEILKFFEARMAEHSKVADCRLLPVEEEFIYNIRRYTYNDELRVWLSDRYRFTDMDFYNRPSQLGAGDYIVIADPAGYSTASTELIRQSRIGVGKLDVFMGALNKQKLWTYLPPGEE
jgi:hypothetical protein